MIDNKFPTKYDIEFIEQIKDLINKIELAQITIRNFEISTPDDFSVYLSFNFDKIWRR